MTEKRPSPPLDERDFDAIEAAVMETERGRWFLAEFARRNRLGETRLLLEAITRLEQNVGGPRPPEEADAVRAELAAMAATLAEAAAVLTEGGADSAAAALDGFVRSVGTVEAAASDIHDAAERVSEIAWRLREAGSSATLCGELERAAADISTASAFGGLAARRTAALAGAMQAIAERLETLPPGWRPVLAPERARSEPAPAAAPAPPTVPPRKEARRDEAPQPLPPETQDGGAARAPDPPAAAPPELSAPPRTRLQMPVPSLAAIDALDFRERLKLFT